MISLGQLISDARRRIKPHRHRVSMSLDAQLDVAVAIHAMRLWLEEVGATEPTEDELRVLWGSLKRAV